MPILRTKPSYVTLSTDTSLSTERVATSGAGITLTDGGAGNSLRFDFDYISLAHNRAGFIEDFYGYPSALTSYLIGGQASGTGSSVQPSDVGEASSVFGAYTLNTGTTTTGYASIYNTDVISNAIEAFRLGGGITVLEGRVKILNFLSDGTDRYKVLFGFIDSLSTSTVVDGIYFEYTDTASTNWRYCTSNDSSRTENNSSTTVAVNTWYRLKIVVNADASSVEYFIDGTSLGTISTDIPAAAGDELKFGSGIFKSLGVNARITQVDYVALQVYLTSSR